jgi:hypothetical protein
MDFYQIPLHFSSADAYTVESDLRERSEGNVGDE